MFGFNSYRQNNVLKTLKSRIPSTQKLLNACSRKNANSKNIRKSTKGLFLRPRVRLPKYVSDKKEVQEKTEDEKEIKLSMMIMDITYEMVDNKDFIQRRS